ncbi:MAG: DUF5658 family protein [Phycisphaerales bacterium JB039]
MTDASMSARPPLGGLLHPEARARRVIALLACVIVFSLADLHLTTTHLRSAGMIEGNPVARAIMGLNSPAALALWKVLTVGLGVWILYAARRSRAGEAGAWICFVVLWLLMVRWMTYSDEIVQLMPHMAEIGEISEGRWIAFTP